MGHKQKYCHKMLILNIKNMSIMRKFVLTILLFAFTALSSFGQSASSVQNGNWFSPTTWDCTCIPTGNYHITINHQVLLNLDFGLNGGSITIDSNGKLIENVSGRYLVMNSGNIENNGKMKISRLGFFDGEFVNNDSCIVNSVFYSSADVYNFDLITGADSLYINSFFLNDIGAAIDVNQMTVADTLENYGHIEAVDLLNTDFFYNEGIIAINNFLNMDYFENEGVCGFYNFRNEGETENYSYMLGTDMSNSGYLYIDSVAIVETDNNFSNADTANQMAYLEIEGQLSVLANFLNADTIYGVNGKICVQGVSSNTGEMLGYFDFCDVTGSGPPDFNTGFINSGISNCQGPVCFNSREENLQEKTLINVFPNPAIESIYFNISGNTEKTVLEIYDVFGRQVFKRAYNEKEIPQIHRNNFGEGVFIYKLMIEQNVFTGKIVFE